MIFKWNVYNDLCIIYSKVHVSIQTQIPRSLNAHKTVLQMHASQPEWILICDLLVFNFNWSFFAFEKLPVRPIKKKNPEFFQMFIKREQTCKLI